MVKPRFTIDVQTFTNLLLLVVPGGAVYFWTRGDQLDEEAMAAKMTKEHGYPGTSGVYYHTLLPYMVYVRLYVALRMIPYRNGTLSVDASCLPLPRPVCCLKAMSR